VAISGTRWYSVAISGDQWRSVAISGHPGSSSSLIIITCDARRQVSEVVDGVRPAVREPHETCDAADPIEAPRSHGPQRRHPRRRLTEGGVQEHAGRCLAFKCRGLALDEPQEDSIGSQIARGVVDLVVTSSVTSSVALRGTQRHSEALRGTQRHSEALRGTQRHSEALRGTQRHSEALSGTQWHSEALRGTQRHSEALRGTQRHSEALRGT